MGLEQRGKVKADVCYGRSDLIATTTITLQPAIVVAQIKLQTNFSISIPWS